MLFQRFFILEVAVTTRSPQARVSYAKYFVLPSEETFGDYTHIVEVSENGNVGDGMRLCELREKEVINSCDCKRLGCVVDIEFDCSSGQIEALIVPGPGKICGFLGTDSEYVIPFHCVKRIGPDIILIEIREEKFLKKI